MPLANPATSRRQALGLGAAACIAQVPRPPAAAPPDPDAELLDLCRQLDADSQWLRRYDALSSDQWKPTDQAEMEIVFYRWHDASDQITALSATTAAGIRAKAAALGHALIQAIAIDPSLTFEEQAEDYELLAMSLVRDLGGEVSHG